MLNKWCNRTISKTLENKKHLKTIIVLSIGLIFLSSFSFLQIASAGFNFDGPTNLSNTPFGFSSFPQIATSTPHVYVVWTDDEFGPPDIFFVKSDDDGVSFSPVPDNLSNTFGFSDSPQIAASGDDVYVVWSDDELGPPDIFFTISTNTGDTFSFPTDNLSNSFGFSSFPQIAAFGTNAYVAWQEDDGLGSIDIFFVPIINQGTIGTIASLSTNSAFSGFQQIAAAGNDVYVVWQEDDIFAGTTEIFFSKSNDQGSTFSGGLTPISDDDTLPSLFPQIAASGNNVYLVWQDFGTFNDEIYFSTSHDNGNTFAVEKLNLSNSFGISQAPQIAASGDNVYVVWQEENPISFFDDIFLIVSTDGGLTFGNPINLSDSLGFSSFPQVAASGNDVFVVWQDDVSGLNDIFLAASTDNGDSFDTVSAFPTSDNSIEPLFAIASIHIIWQEFTAGNIEVFYNRGVESTTTIEFDALQYKLSDTATVTLTDDASNTDSALAEEIVVSVISDTDGLGIFLTLTETDVDTGIFSGSLTFTSGTSSGTELESSPGDTINASFGAIDETANIFPREILFDLSLYTLSNFAKVTVNDQNSNDDPLVIETITIDLTSDTDPIGITLDLIETGPNDGIFENNNLIFMTGNTLFPSSGGTVSVTQEETDFGFKSDDTINTINVEVRSTSDPIGILALDLTETLPNSGVFQGIFGFTSGPTAGNFLQVIDGDIFSVEYRDEIANGLIIPNPDGAVGAIQAAIGDSVTASFLGVSDISDIGPGTGGGGGGGLLRPGLVFDFIIELFGGDSGPDKSAPTVSSSSLITLGLGADGFGGTLSESNLDEKSGTKIVKPGEKLTLRFEVYENRGADNIFHVTLYLNGKGHSNLLNTDTSIRYNKFNELEIRNEQGIIDEASFEIIKIDSHNLILKFDIIFAKNMDTSDILLRMWDYRRNQVDLEFVDAIQVVQPESTTIVTPTSDDGSWSKSVETSVSKSTTIFKEDFDGSNITFDLENGQSVTKYTNIPIWVKNNANWWSQEKINDNDFVAGIHYLVEQNIMHIPERHVVSILETPPPIEIPNWVKSNANWWSEGLLSDDEFVQSIEWLIEEGIMTV